VKTKYTYICTVVHILIGTYPLSYDTIFSHFKSCGTTVCAMKVFLKKPTLIQSWNSLCFLQKYLLESFVPRYSFSRSTCGIEKMDSKTEKKSEPEKKLGFMSSNLGFKNSISVHGEIKNLYRVHARSLPLSSAFFSLCSR
jgi:hypothetical protein